MAAADVVTWRYLRLAIVGLVVALAAAVAWEVHLSGCLQESVSAYFYTPARGVLTGALVAVGVCLFSLRGTTDAEDVFLDLAGLFAPVVALVPIPRGGAGSSAACAPSYPGSDGGRVEGYSNAMVALLVLGAAAIVLAAVLAVVRSRHPERGAVPRRLRLSGLAGVVVWVAALLTFALARGWFDRYVHYVAAVGMFVAAWLAVGVDTFDRCARAMGWGAIRALYLAVFVAMPGVAAGIGVAYLAGWRNGWLFWLEAGEVVAFVVFWIVQSVHLWDRSDRGPIPRARADRPG